MQKSEKVQNVVMHLWAPRIRVIPVVLFATFGLLLTVSCRESIETSSVENLLSNLRSQRLNRYWGLLQTWLQKTDPVSLDSSCLTVAIRRSPGGHGWPMQLSRALMPSIFYGRTMTLER